MSWSFQFPGTCETMRLIELTVAAWLGLGLLYLWLLHELLRRPGHWVPGRRVVSIASGARWHGSQDVVFQDGPFGCALAVLQMLLASRRVEGIVQPADGTTCQIPPLTMADMSALLMQCGISAKGYQFSSASQMSRFLAENPDNSVLLLLRDSGSRLSLHGLLTLPTQAAHYLAALFGKKRATIYHWVLLDAVCGNEVVVRDPFLGKIGWRPKRFHRLWTGFGLVAEPPRNRLTPEEVADATA